MSHRTQKPFSKATLYSSAIIFILFGAMGFFSIPAFSVIFLEPSWQVAGKSAWSAGRPDPAKGARHLKRRPRGEPSGRQAQAVQVGEVKLSTPQPGAGGASPNHRIGSQARRRSQPRGEGLCWMEVRPVTGSHRIP